MTREEKRLSRAERVVCFCFCLIGVACVLFVSYIGLTVGKRLDTMPLAFGLSLIALQFAAMVEAFACAYLAFAD
jgi:uncharacterized transporter YbjL